MKTKYTRPRLALAFVAAFGASNQALAVSASDIVGGWGGVDITGGGELVFMADGTFVHLQDSAGGPGGYPGIERGTYSWDPLTGAFSTVLSVDTNGEWGSSHPQGALTIQISGNTLTGTDNSGTFSTTRIADVPNSILGTWYQNDLTAYPPNSGNAGGLVTFSFMSDGTYLMAQDGSSISDPNGQDGMERGTYSWNPGTGAFTFTTLSDTNGQWGLSHGGPSAIQVSGNTLMIDGNAFATRVSAVPVPAAAWLFGSGLIGLIGAARRKAA